VAYTANRLSYSKNNQALIMKDDISQIKSHCTSAKRMTSILRHVAEAFPPARQGTILNSHRVISIATNTSMVAMLMTTDVGLPDAV